jgi:pyruvate decarboxylase
MHADYNDVPGWDYGALFQAFAPHAATRTHAVKTGAAMDALLRDEAFCAAAVPQLVEVFMAPDDVPAGLGGIFKTRDAKLAKAKADGAALA